MKLNSAKTLIIQIFHPFFVLHNLPATLNQWRWSVVFWCFLVPSLVYWHYVSRFSIQYHNHLSVNSFIVCIICYSFPALSQCTIWNFIRAWGFPCTVFFNNFFFFLLISVSLNINSLETSLFFKLLSSVKICKLVFIISAYFFGSFYVFPVLSLLSTYLCRKVWVLYISFKYLFQNSLVFFSTNSYIVVSCLFIKNLTKESRWILI